MLQAVREVLPGCRQLKLTFKQDAENDVVCYLLYLYFLGFVEVTESCFDALNYAATNKTWGCESDRIIVVNPPNNMRSSKWLEWWREHFVDKLHQAIEKIEIME